MGLLDDVLVFGLIVGFIYKKIVGEYVFESHE